MRWLGNILIQPGRVQRLALKQQGVMLSSLHSALIKGSFVHLVVNWSDFQTAHSVSIRARACNCPTQGIALSLHGDEHEYVGGVWPSEDTA